jgi:hypothetical protein
LEAEKAGGLSSKVALSNINGRGNKFQFFTWETEVKKKSATQKKVTGIRIQQFTITQIYS